MENSRIITVTLNAAVDRLVQVDGLAVGAHSKYRTLSQTPGGKGVNVSKVLAAMEITSIATGFLGSANRNIFDAVFVGGMVEDRFITLDGMTRENITLVDSSGVGEIHLRDEGLRVSENYLSGLEKLLAELIHPGDLAIFSGSLPPGLAPADQARLAKITTSAGGKVIADTSGEALREIINQPVTLIKPNVGELCELLNVKWTNVQTLRPALDNVLQYVEKILLSDGSRGAYLISSDEIFFAPTPKVEVVNTVGCGDTLLGAFAGAMAVGKAPQEALKKAVACAAASAANEASAVFDRELANKLENEIEVKTL